jgi:hypothetical protein
MKPQEPMMPVELALIQELKSPPVAAAYFLESVKAGRLNVTQAVHYLSLAGYPYVTVTKLRACDGAGSDPGVWGEYVEGIPNDSSLPCDYTLSGLMIQAPRIGGPVIVLRLLRNDTAVPGVFQSTFVKSVDGDTFTTENSVYEIKLL